MRTDSEETSADMLARLTPAELRGLMETHAERWGSGTLVEPEWSLSAADMRTMEPAAFYDTVAHRMERKTSPYRSALR